jgi:hypothetical protein
MLCPEEVARSRRGMNRVKLDGVGGFCEEGVLLCWAMLRDGSEWREPTEGGVATTPF